ncbi:MAG: neutral zinc metallopeptidase [Maricaulaceae bacterium]|jgi:predicted metalloprotease
MARTDRQRRSTNVEDRRGQGPARRGGGGGAASLIVNLLFSRAGRRFLLPVIAVLVVASVIFGPGRVLGFLSAVLSGEVGTQSARLDPETEARFEDSAVRILSSTEDVWGEFYAADGADYPEPTLVLFTGSVSSACGFASAAVGPFYCPSDSKLYLDLAFFRDMETELGAGGDFAQAYVIAHEVGHHVQNIDGVLAWSGREKQRAGSAMGANRVQVRVELMADCLAGVWAGQAEEASEIVLEPGDVQEAIGAAEAVGDDTLQRRGGGAVQPDAFTHGSSAQRIRWFERGFATRDKAQCDAARTAPYESL